MITKNQLTYELRMMPNTELRMHPNEQQLRITHSALAGLRSDVAETRVIAALIVMKSGGKYVIIDGNRRFLAATDMGWAEVPCQVLPPGDIDKMFVQLNAHMRSMRGNERLQFLANASDKWDKLAELMPKQFRRHLRELEAATSRKFVIQLGLEGKYGPDIMQRVNALQSNLTRFQIGVDDGDVVRWMIKHQMQNVVNMLVRQPGRMTRSQANTMRRRIEYDKPFTFRKHAKIPTDE